MTATETATCRTCGADTDITRDENGYAEQLDSAGEIQCDDCAYDHEVSTEGITADMLRRIQGFMDGAIIDIGSGRYLPRPMFPRADETSTHFAHASENIVVRATTMWDGHDLDGLTDDERYELLALHLNAI